MANTPPDPPQAKLRGSYRPGAETRRRLLDAALDLFARQGFDATSTRQIASAAGVALPAIGYHFGGKQQLHLACAEDVVDRYRAVMGEALVGIAGRRASATPDQARSDLKTVLNLLVGMVQPDGGQPGWLDFMLREMAVAGPAHDLLSRALWQPGLELVSDLIATARAADKAGQADRAQALLVLSQLSALSNFRRVSRAFLAGADPGRALLAAMEASIDRLR